jgi:hypothetical protein
MRNFYTPKIPKFRRILQNGILGDSVQFLVIPYSIGDTQKVKKTEGIPCEQNSVMTLV